GGGSGASADPFGGLSPWAPSCHGASYLSPNNASQFVNSYLGFGRVDGANISANGPAPEGPRGIRDRLMGMGMMGGGAGMGTLQALLTEMSGLKKPRGFMNRVVRRVLGVPPKDPPKYRIMIVMATNMPQALDEALLRPGRIDRIYKVGYPSKAGRVRTYQGYLAKVSNNLTDEDVDKLATITPYATGATIKDMVNEALILAIGDGREMVTWADILRAKQLKELGPPEDVEYIERERHAVAVHEACHAVVAYRVRHHLEIDLATIEKGSSYLGMVASIQPEDQFTSWRSEYESDVMVSLASLVGERAFFSGDSSSGVSGDLESATYFASMMEGYWGMGSTIASHAITQRIGVGGGGGGGGNGRGQGKGGNNRRELLTGSLGGRIENKLAELLHRTEELLEQNRREVLAVAHALETHKTLNGEDVVAVIEGKQGTIIDGRPYASENFLPAAERYHERVVEAHKNHSQIEVPLIAARDWAPELVRALAPVDGQPALTAADVPAGAGGVWPESPSDTWGNPPAN
ncbi:MAG: AAA family ATPase, partial [Acidimicrobiaceae bacterium]|nr:AAA family ATPase [Acidimicrobiaceae bacterium]